MQVEHEKCLKRNFYWNAQIEGAKSVPYKYHIAKNGQVLTFEAFEAFEARIRILHQSAH